MRKKILLLTALVTVSLAVSGCGQKTAANGNTGESITEESISDVSDEASSEELTDTAAAKQAQADKYADAVKIVLSDDGITVNGEKAPEEEGNSVYLSNDIIYYEDRDTYDSGNKYGEGTDADKHSAEEAAAHTVVNITEPGEYYLTGTLSAGQIFVNVGEDETDKVTLILDGVDITCTVAPAVMFYEVYECDADASEENATHEADTADAGAKVIIADGSVNNVTGSYVARIYKDNDEEKKLHKYDGAFYSKMSMEVTGGEEGDGILNINAENEGLDTELHLTINGGNINITALNDGINVNEDGISVCTINDGCVYVQSVNGEEGDGIDSNGWIVINGGTVVSSSNPDSPDSGLDADMGIYINGGTVISCGNMYDEVSEESKADFIVLKFSASNKGNLVIKDENDEIVLAFDCTNDYSDIVISSDAIKEGTYHIYSGGVLTGEYYSDTYSYEGGTQLAYTGDIIGMGGKPDGSMNEPLQGDRPDMSGQKHGQGEMPDNGSVAEPGGMHGIGGEPDNGEMPSLAEGETMPEPPEMNQQKPDGNFRDGMENTSGEKNTDFVIKNGANYFSGITTAE